MIFGLSDVVVRDRVKLWRKGWGKGKGMVHFILGVAVSISWVVSQVQMKDETRDG